MAPKKYILEVAPLSVLPYRKAIFSYSSSAVLNPGTIVSVPFSGRTLLGVILQCTQSTPEDTGGLKEIFGIEERGILTPEQITLAKEVSTLTYTPLGKVLKHFVPKRAGVRAMANMAKKNIPPTTKPVNKLKVNPIKVKTFSNVEV